MDLDTNNLILFISKFILNGLVEDDKVGQQTQQPVQQPARSPYTQACYNSLNNPSTLQLFQAKSIPSISIQNYLIRILRYCPSTNEVFISLIIYFDRMKLLSSFFTLNNYNIHRLIIAGITVSSKFFSDIFYTNSRYAKV